MKDNLIKLIVAVSVLTGFGAPVWAVTQLEDLTVMALGPLDGRAVVKLPDGKMQVLKLGDTIPDTKATVQQVLTDKLVVEETIEKEGKPKVKQTVWILKPTKVGEKSLVQRLDREGPPPTPIVKPGLGQINDTKK